MYGGVLVSLLNRGGHLREITTALRMQDAIDFREVLNARLTYSSLCFEKEKA